MHAYVYQTKMPAWFQVVFGEMWLLCQMESVRVRILNMDHQLPVPQLFLLLKIG